MSVYKVTTALVLITTFVDILFPSDFALTAMFVAIFVWLMFGID